MAWDAMRAAKAHHEGALFARANVVGVALGRKVVDGAETSETCVVVYVERKLPEALLRTRDIVPKDLDGVRTDVVETGRFRALMLMQRPTEPRTARVRPAPGGVSAGHPDVTAGTLGVLARRPWGGPAILSNNHIFANGNAARVGDPILQPAPADGGTDADAIARLEAFVPIVFADRELGFFGHAVERAVGPLLAWFGLGLRRLPSGAANVVDAAIGTPLAEGLVAPGILDVGRVEGIADPAIGMRVRKSGRTTALTSGRITGIDGVVSVDYGGRTAMFRRQIIGDVPSKGGDSGSLVVDEGNRAVGLLFAGSATTTLMNPIRAVMEQLNIEL